MKINTINKLAALLFFVCVLTVNSQTIRVEEDNVELKFVKAKKASKIINASNVFVRSKKLKRIRVKIKMKSLDNKSQVFDPNKLSLIDYTYKLRYRPTDILFQNLTDWWHFKKISKTKPKKKSNDYLYAPNVDDTFLDFEFEDIKNVLIPINFNTTKKPDIHIVHFEPKKLRSRNVYLYFLFPKDIKDATLYYGKEKLADTNFK